MAQNQAIDKSVSNVGTSSAQVIAAETGRRYIYIHNPGTADIYISLDTTPAVVAGAGAIKLSPGGTFWNDCQAIASNAFNAIASTGSSNPLTIWDIPS